MTRTLRERLLTRLDTTGDCWIWTGGVSDSGYGAIAVGTGTQLVHRVAYELLIGPIPEGLHIDHTCRSRRCCNPAHLEAVTQAENNTRAWVRRRRAECKRGHGYTPENTIATRSGRNCRTCKNARARQLRAERTAAA